MKELQKATERLAELCKTVPMKLREIKEEDFILSLSPGKWSRKQILGHLVDSAANNDQRFIRIQYQNEPVIFYEQDEWVRLQYYNKENSEELIELWRVYNLHLLHIIKNTSVENLTKNGVSKAGMKNSLCWYITDYVEHLEHHLKQIFQ